MNLNQVFQLALAAAFPAVACANSITGPSSSQSPYVIGSQPGVVTVSVLTVGDAVNYKADGVTPYRMVGIPDGLGAFDNGDGTFTVLMNQELGSTIGVARDHGMKGAFVSKWIIDKGDFTVRHGEDLMKQAWAWTTNGYVLNTNQPFNRFCSADLPALTAFYNPASGLGYHGRIFMDGEESGTEGRAMAHLMDGNSYELPAVGKLAFENVVANPGTGDKTVVAGTDDGTGGQVYMYAGTKTSSADPINAAGLDNGVLYGIKVAGFAAEPAATGIPSGTAFTCVNLGDVKLKTGSQIESDSQTNGVTSFNRPEDSCWDPSNPNDFYFVTTASFTGNSRLWRLRFVDASRPELGGTIDMLLAGGEGPKMMDNITVSKRGSVFILEDVGNNPHIGKIWRYSIAKDTVEQVAAHDPNRFAVGGSKFLTQDEEASGIIPMNEILGEGWYLFDTQAHYNTGDSETVEGGQLQLLHFPPGREK
ncbi:MAG TPA: alkaline phosphatase PhoX [Verrucomicrobiae bacterium]|nr:alkaline phosphatase PhoX [Verrucomicrobiae bacterium]